MFSFKSIIRIVNNFFWKKSWRTLICTLVFISISGCAFQESLLLEEDSSDELSFEARLDPVDPSIRIELGQKYAEQNELRLAISQFDSALSIDPQNGRALYEKGRALILLGYETEGQNCIVNALETSEGNSIAADIGIEYGQPFVIRQITKSHFHNAFPSYTPDGQQIIFQSKQQVNWDIFKLDIIHNTQQRLTTHMQRDESPIISADGSLVAFTSTRDVDGAYRLEHMQREIYILQTDTKKEQRITFTHSDNWHPTFSPDTRRLYYVTSDSSNFAQHQIWQFDLHSGNSRSVPIPDSIAKSPCVSPDGLRMAFVGQGPSTAFLNEYFFLNQEYTILNNQFSAISCPSYSPDGRTIVFSGKIDDQHDIYLISIDDLSLQQLTNDAAIDGCPRFSPNGERIIFHSNKTGLFQLYEIDLLQPLTKDEAGKFITN